jgi:hypothetical protein
MSEFSCSYHIRTDDLSGTAKKLKAAGLAGLAFGPANGWLTFVPYEEHSSYSAGAPDAFAKVLSRALNAPVLHYLFGEDHGWGFLLVNPDMRVSGFEASWDPEPRENFSALDLDLLSPFVDVKKVEPYLRDFDIERAFDLEPAFRFAEALGLPSFRWLSPSLVQIDTDHFLADGAKKIGEKPRSVLDPIEGLKRNLPLPRPDLSAREAFALIDPFVTNSDIGWYPVKIGFSGALNRDGRLSVGVGAWEPSYIRESGGSFIRASLFFNGNLSFTKRDDPALALMNPRPRPLPDDWLDSTEISSIVARVLAPRELNDDFSLSLKLESDADGSARWIVERHILEREARTTHRLYAFATTGVVAFEMFEQTVRQTLFKLRIKKTAQGGDWVDVPVKDGDFDLATALA